jgi:hypothetical protein
VTSPAVPAASPAAAGELRLFVRCHEHVLSLGAAWVERILLTDEAPVPEPPAAFGVYPNAPRACLGVLATADAAWAAWDMAMLLELPPVGAAYLLVQRPYEGGMLRLALRSDRCLHVGRLPDARPLTLPHGVARQRWGLLRGAFPMQPLKLRQQGEAPVGLDLDLKYLWTAEELAFARDLLARAETPDPGGDDGAV